MFWQFFRSINHSIHNLTSLSVLYTHSQWRSMKFQSAATVHYSFVEMILRSLCVPVMPATTITTSNSNAFSVVYQRLRKLFTQFHLTIEK